MSFYGKQFKKTKFENVDEFMEEMKVPEKTRMFVKSMDTTSSFKKNDDGSVQYTVYKDGKEVMSHKMVPGSDGDFVTPDGIKTKVNFTVKDNALESVLTFPDGGKLNMQRVFDGNKMQMIVWKDGLDMKAITHYEAV